MELVSLCQLKSGKTEINKYRPISGPRGPLDSTELNAEVAEATLEAVLSRGFERRAEKMVSGGWFQRIAATYAASHWPLASVGLCWPLLVRLEQAARLSQLSKVLPNPERRKGLGLSLVFWANG